MKKIYCLESLKIYPNFFGEEIRIKEILLNKNHAVKLKSYNNEWHGND